jgi:hypothetical protein
MRALTAASAATPAPAAPIAFQNFPALLIFGCVYRTKDN